MAKEKVCVRLEEELLFHLKGKYNTENQSEAIMEIGETEGIRFLFNGQYGVQTEGNGLYFLRARYYNTDSRRFLNRYILTGSIGETQSLNRYAYTQGDPVNQMDPFGLYPGGFGWKAAGHGALDLLGLIPVLGDVLDVVNSVWYFADGDAGQGASSLLSALPALGTAAGPAMKGVLKLSDKSVKGVQGMLKLTGNVSTFGRGAYGGYQNGRQMWEKYAVNREKVGIETITEVGSLALNMLSCVYAGKDVSSTAKELSKLRNRGDGSLRMDLQYFGGSGSKGNGKGGTSEIIPDLTTGKGYDAGDSPVSIDGEWSENDMKQALLGHPPRGLGSPDIHHGGQMPGASKHEILPENHRTNAALHPNKYNQGVTAEMRKDDKELHWWYRAREQGADKLLPDWIYDD